MSGLIRISRVSKDHFTVLAHHAVRNRELSRRARGLLWELCSLPDEWDLRHDWLSGNASDSKHKLQSAVTELREHGYLGITRSAGGETTWRVTDDPDRFPIEKPHPDNQDEPHPDSPDMDNRDVTEERTSLQSVEEERGPPSQDDLFAEQPEVLNLISEVGKFCQRLGVKQWPLKSASLTEWCRERLSEVEYATIDLIAETRKCGDHWEPRTAPTKKKSPHMRLRNWWSIAASDQRRKNPNDGPDDPQSDVGRLHDMIGGGE